MSKKNEANQTQPKIEPNDFKGSETLGQFATRHGLSLGKLRALNDLTPTAKVKAGQRLVVT